MTAALFARTVQDGDCLIWTGQINRYGYGVVSYGGKKWGAHRLIYMQERGPIPPGLQLDHLCHSASPDCPGGPTCKHRACVNPAHLEPVTSAVNSSRSVQAQQTECLRGHAYTPENTGRTRKTGTRFCRTCARAAWRRSRERRLQRI